MGVQANGQIIPDAPALYKPPAQQINGSALEAAAQKTLASQAAAAEAAQKLGAGQKGAGRRKRKSKKVKRGGAQTMNASPINIPTAGSIPGVDPMKNHLDAVNNLNQIKADGMFDKTLNAQPIAVGGRRKRSRKAKNGRRHNRTHRRRNHKSTRSHRRSRRAV
jgi:pyruvate/2-oxoglutarate dehydrogenase complex dihydrolipoamide acyltransferase (E2) component